jgi:ribonuclease HII
VALTDLVSGHSFIFIPALVVGPLVTVGFTGPGQTAAVAAYALVLAVVLGGPDDIWGTGTHASAIATVAVEIIDSINILQASLRAMNEALLQLAPIPDHTLVDGPHIFSLRCPQTPVIDGDAKSFSIAAASVLAKVTRDRLMLELDKAYPQYGFADHKGYSTPQHLAAIEKHGACPIHRRSFSPFRQTAEPTLFM